MTQANPSTPATTPRRFRWRRLLQYRMRTLLILIAVLSVVFAIFGVRWNSARRQKAAIVKIVAKRGYVSYPHDKLKKWADDPPILPAPQFSIDWLGIDFFANVSEVDFPNNPPTTFADEDVQYLLDLRGLEWVGLDGTDVTDDGLKKLARISTLTSMTASPLMTAQGLEEFRRSRPDVRLSALLFPASGLKTPHDRISQIERTVGIKLKASSVNLGSGSLDGSVKSGFSVSLEGDEVTHENMRLAAQLTTLVCLQLEGPHVTDQHLATMKDHKYLAKLNLQSTNNVTDKGLHHVESLPGLKFLRVHSAKVTVEGVERLRKVAPQCAVEHVVDR